MAPDLTGYAYPEGLPDEEMIVTDTRPHPEAAGTVADPMVDLVIVGGGPAGLGVARGYREAGGTGTVLLISADDHAPYARPPLTKEYLRGESDAAELPLAPDSWYAEHQVTLRLGSPVTDLRRADRRLTMSDGTTVGFRRLALATGSAPVPLGVPGGDDPGLVYVRDRHSGEALRGIAERGGDVVVIGSGFIGCEAAASFALRGVDVVLVTDEETPHAGRLGSAAGERITSWLEEVGVDLVLGDGVAKVSSQSDGGWRVDLVSGRSLMADAVVSGSGARANIRLAEAAGLRLDGGGISTDAHLQTSDSSIWAAGDVACAHNPSAGRPLRVEHWGEAEAMGEIAGANIAGADIAGADIAGTAASGRARRWEQAPGFWSTIGQHTLKYTAWGDGYDEAELVENGDGWAVWYAQDSTVVGLLCSDWDEAYERGQDLVERGASLAEALEEQKSPT